MDEDRFFDVEELEVEVHLLLVWEDRCWDDDRDWMGVEVWGGGEEFW